MQRQFLIKNKKIEKCDMTPDQERLGPENRTEHYLWKGMFFSTLKDIIEAQNKTYN